jgi:hypothetical protein
MSALPLKADIRRHDWDVRFVPIADIGYRSLDHLVGPEENGLWDSRLASNGRLF